MKRSKIDQLKSPQDLTRDTFVCIAKFLRPLDLIKCRIISKKWHRWASCNMSWYACAGKSLRLWFHDIKLLRASGGYFANLNADIQSRILNDIVVGEPSSVNFHYINKQELWAKCVTQNKQTTCVRIKDNCVTIVKNGKTHEYPPPFADIMINAYRQRLLLGHTK